MKFYLNGGGLFYSCGALLNVSKKPEGVSRYIIYENIDDLQIVKTKKKVHIMKNGQVLEVDTISGERRFFNYEEGFFSERKVKPIDILEGEDELLKHLGLLGKKEIRHYPEDDIF